MLSFQPITVDAIHRFEPYLNGHNGRFCDFTPSNLYIWRDFYYKAYTVIEDMLILALCGEDGETWYSLPMGNGNEVAALHALKAYAQQQGDPLRLSLIPEDKLPLVRQVLGDAVIMEAEREWCDYLYDAPSMAAFSGAAYAKQRNHVRRFDRLYPDHRAERLTPTYLNDVETLLGRFAVVRGKDSSLAAEEIDRARTALHHMEELGLLGTVLFVDDRLVGFSAGARVGDTLYVNFEKADTAYQGVYQKLVQSFAQMYADDSIRYINREEDCGDEGLRKSKLAYHPVALLSKYSATL